MSVNKSVYSGLRELGNARPWYIRYTLPWGLVTNLGEKKYLQKQDASLLCKVSPHTENLRLRERQKGVPGLLRITHGLCEPGSGNHSLWICFLPIRCGNNNSIVSFFLLCKLRYHMRSVRERTWWLGALIDLPEDLGLVFSTHRDWQSPITVVLEDPKPSSGLHEYQTCTHHTDTWLGKILKHIKSRKECDADSKCSTQ